MQIKKELGLLPGSFILSLKKTPPGGKLPVKKKVDL